MKLAVRNSLSKNEVEQISWLHKTALKASILNIFSNQILALFYYFLVKSAKVIFLTVSDKSKIVGFLVGLKDSNRHIHHFPLLQFLAVRMEYRRKGVGRQLVKKFSSELAVFDQNHFIVETRSDDEHANNFYQGMGFLFLKSTGFWGRRMNIYKSP